MESFLELPIRHSLLNQSLSILRVIWLVRILLSYLPLILNPLISFPETIHSHPLLSSLETLLSILLNQESCLGLTLNSDSGVISGSPSQSITTQNVIIKAENPVSDQSFTLSFTTRILPTLLYYSQEVDYTPINKPFSITPECDGDYLQYSLEEGSLPSGLSLDSSSGVIEGSPINSTQLVSLTVRATNEVGSIQSIVSICIRIPLSLFQYPKSSYRLVRGKSFVVIPTVEGDAPRFRVTSGILPDGLRVDETTG